MQNSLFFVKPRPKKKNDQLSKILTGLPGSLEPRSLLLSGKIQSKLNRSLILYFYFSQEFFLVPTYRKYSGNPKK